LPTANATSEQDGWTHKHHQFRFLSDLPAAAVVGGIFSFFAAAPLFAAVPVAAFVVVAGAFLAAGRPFGAGLWTIVVPAEVLLASELRPTSFSLPGPAAAPRFAVRLAVRFPGTGMDLVGLAGRTVGFSGALPAGLKGDRGRVRELWDLGERTAEGTTLRDAVRAAFVFAAAVALARFFGLARSCWDC
jgi:hypothetical protein